MTTFKIGDTVLFEGWLWIFEGYIGKTGKMAQIARKQRDGDDYGVRRVYVTSLTDANEEHMTKHYLESCDLCQAELRLLKAMDSIDEIPDFDIAMFDDAITAAYEALQVALTTLTHYPHDEELVP